MKIWNMRKKKEAVSPVIATILMVAITVVLAAVLYVMVMGFGGTSDQAPACDLAIQGTTKVTISISPATDYADMTFKLNTTTAEPFAATLAECTVGTGTSAVTVLFVDVGGDGKVTTGDYFTITKGSATADAELFVLWTSGGTTQQISSIII